MITIKKHGKILEPTNLPFETQAVLNPAVFQDGNSVHIIYRAIDADGLSCLGYARLEGPNTVIERWQKPYMYPKLKVESKGMEDPRIVRIDGTFYLTYVAHNGKDAVTALASGGDILNLKRDFTLSPKIPYKEAGKIFRYTKLKDEYYFFESYYQKYCGGNVLIWHKDLILFSEKVNGQFYFLERILPDIQVLSCDDLGEMKDKYYWIHHLMHLCDSVLLEPLHGFEGRHLGGGAPPIRTEKGWLVIYHSAQETNDHRVYYGAAALLDLEDPSKVIGRLPYPIISPDEGYETTGLVNNVVFPTGTAVFGEDLYIYYGAADKYIAVGSVNLNSLLDELLKHPA